MTRTDSISHDSNSKPDPTDDIAALRALVEGTAGSTGDEFFQRLVEHLSRALGVEHAMIAVFAGENRVRTIAYWKCGQLSENVEYDLPGTPCEDVVRGNLCHYPTGVSRRFPNDLPLVEMGIESYLGVPLVGSEGRHLGHLCVFDTKPLPDDARKLMFFRIFAARATAELARLQLEQELIEREQQYRDLYDEAPIAYVQEDLESRFISANQAAMRILGITPEEVSGTVGMSFIPDTPDAQRRVQEAFASVGRGTDTSGVVLELRRKDNGKPIWIQWWSKPEPDGKYTRTMFVDITERVLLEQEQARLKAQNLYLQEEIKSVHNFEEIVGSSAGLRQVLESVRRVASTDASVLITGETGSGKELIARAIHSNSRRAEKPLIKLNCAALPDGLVESELFGHEKGAFSGAIQRRIGRFELANGGTIFLDEVGELPLEMQSKLLRVLQEREFERVGGSQTISTDVRVIAATNRDLRKSVQEGTFREDLYFRLNVFPVALPPLRDRGDDIPMLVHFFMEKSAARIGHWVEGVEAETMERLKSYHWPGNIRELQNVIERALILTTTPLLRIEPEVFATAVPPADSSSAAVTAGGRATGDLNTLQREHIRSVLEECRWVIEGEQGAAKVLGLHPNTLRSRMKKLGLSRPGNFGD